ncbi:MAG: acetyl-CoA carboxylase biotin carboxylase subunit [Elusimicrobiota bacterium]
MFKKVLIANRGEIAVRIIRACKELGIKTVAIHSDADRESLHVKLADESICIGPAPVTESYLNYPSIISAAEISGADAIHPGYGFLAENTQFAGICADCNIKFIGPSKDAILKMGDKIQARETVKKAGVPVVPGTDGPINADDPNLLKIAKKIGFPLMVKARAGGGGKGMRVVQNEEALNNALLTAQAEAKSSFGNSQVYLEKYIEEPRHVEFQIVADKFGETRYLPERDCSIQRRHQKLVEESPCPAVDSKLRERMGHAAIRCAKTVGYTTVGTIEFLLDKEKNFYFLEMNTRIQVEHTVTEMITGLDLVRMQIRLAAGEKLEVGSLNTRMLGHVIECRINAEDPDLDFIPSPGKVTQFIPPGGPGVRVDTHLYSGYTIPSFYDSLLAKLIVIDKDRKRAIDRMRRALGEFVIENVKTTIPFHIKVMNDEKFQAGKVSTDFVQKRILSQ